MKEKELLKADKLFERLSKIMPCNECKNEECEECRWTTFAATRYGRRWDMYNYFDGGHEENKK